MSGPVSAIKSYILGGDLAGGSNLLAFFFLLEEGREDLGVCPEEKISKRRLNEG